MNVALLQSSFFVYLAFATFWLRQPVISLSSPDTSHIAVCAIKPWWWLMPLFVTLIVFNLSEPVTISEMSIFPNSLQNEPSVGIRVNLSFMLMGWLTVSVEVRCGPNNGSGKLATVYCGGQIKMADWLDSLGPIQIEMHWIFIYGRVIFSTLFCTIKSHGFAMKAIPFFYWYCHFSLQQMAFCCVIPY